MTIEPDDRMKEIDAKEALIFDSLGDSSPDAITRALSYDQKQEIYDFIIRVYDLEQEQ